MRMCCSCTVTLATDLDKVFLDVLRAVLTSQHSVQILGL